MKTLGAEESERMTLPETWQGKRIRLGKRLSFFVVLVVAALLSVGGVAYGQSNTDYGQIRFDTKLVEEKLKNMNGQIFHTVKMIIIIVLFSVSAYMFLEAWSTGTLRNKWLQFIGIAVFLAVLTASDRIYEGFSKMGGVDKVQTDGQKWQIN